MACRRCSPRTCCSRRSTSESVASVSPRWIKDILRRELGFKGVVFTDDMSMAGAAVAGDIVERSWRALDAGSDMVLICNSRPSVVTVLDKLKFDPPPDVGGASRAHARPGEGTCRATTLMASTEWQQCREMLARCAAPPSLKLEADPTTRGQA